MCYQNDQLFHNHCFLILHLIQEIDILSLDYFNLNFHIILNMDSFNYEFVINFIFINITNILIDILICILQLNNRFVKKFNHLTIFYYFFYHFLY